MIVLGLTGSIGMGKSVIAKQLGCLSIPVLNSDAVVHQLLGAGGHAVARITEAFPDTYENGSINRKLLGRKVFGDQKKLKLLESILHPLVQAAQKEFIARQKLLGHAICVLEIPLLFETNAQERCDYVIVVTCPAFLQRQRVLRRAAMTEQQFQQILALQLPDHEKRLRADFIVQTGLGYSNSMKRVKHIAGLFSSRNKKEHL